MSQQIRVRKAASPQWVSAADEKDWAPSTGAQIRGTPFPPAALTVPGPALGHAFSRISVLPPRTVQRKCEECEKGGAPCPNCRGESDKESLGSAETPVTLARQADGEESAPPEKAVAGDVVEPIPDVFGTAAPHEVVAFGGAGVRLQGRTNANFGGSTFRTTGTHTSRGTGCSGCPPAACVQVTGILDSNFVVTTRVSLPSVSDFPDLTPCQQARVRNAIDTVLAPHEQQHVDAFNTYNGASSDPFTFNGCRQDFNTFIRGKFDSMEGTRQAAAKAASDALDPPGGFFFAVDLNCQEGTAQSIGTQGAAESAGAPAGSTAVGAAL